MRKRDRELNTIAKQFNAKVCQVQSGHKQIVGKGWAMTCPNTPSDWRSVRNLIADLRRYTRFITKEQTA